jgi:hypothetical protein
LLAKAIVHTESLLHLNAHQNVRKFSFNPPSMSILNRNGLVARVFIG